MNCTRAFLEFIKMSQTFVSILTHSKWSRWSWLVLASQMDYSFRSFVHADLIPNIFSIRRNNWTCCVWRPARLRSQCACVRSETITDRWKCKTSQLLELSLTACIFMKPSKCFQNTAATIFHLSELCTNYHMNFFKIHVYIACSLQRSANYFLSTRARTWPHESDAPSLLECVTLGAIFSLSLLTIGLLEMIGD